MASGPSGLRPSVIRRVLSERSAADAGDAAVAGAEPQRSRTTSTSRRSMAFAPSSKCLPGRRRRQPAVRVVVAQRQRKDRAVPRHRRGDRHVAEEDHGAGRARRRDRRARRRDAAGQLSAPPAPHPRHGSRASIRRNRSCSPEEQPVAFIAFDLLRDGDRDLRNLCLYERRELLEALFKKHKPPASESRPAHRRSRSATAPR